jgi:hypothetical protein
MLVTFPSPHPGAPTRPFTPKVLQARERAPTLCSFAVFHVRLTKIDFENKNLVE